MTTPATVAGSGGKSLSRPTATEVVEGNHYFPAASVKRDKLTESATHTTCPWKGVASYFNVVVGEDINIDAAWYYPEAKEAAKHIEGRIAFWRGVEVKE